MNNRPKSQSRPRSQAKPKSQSRPRSQAKPKSRSRSRYNKRMQRMQNGGHAGTVMPSEYFGGNSGRYYPAGSDELKPCPRQFARSHGIIHADGRMAGPNLFPKHGGGKRTNRTNKLNRSKKPYKKSTKRTNKSINKSRTTKRSNKSTKRSNKSKK